MIVVLMGQFLWTIDYFSSSIYFYYFISNLIISFTAASSCSLTSEFLWYIFISTIFLLGNNFFFIIQPLIDSIFTLVYSSAKVTTISTLVSPSTKVTTFKTSPYRSRLWTNPIMFPATWLLLSSIMVPSNVCGMHNRSSYIYKHGSYKSYCFEYDIIQSSYDYHTFTL
jgi:hypothetical protein